MKQQIGERQKRDSVTDIFQGKGETLLKRPTTYVCTRYLDNSFLRTCWMIGWEIFCELSSLFSMLYAIT